MNRPVPAAAPTLVLAVAAVLVLAGCAAPVADSSPPQNVGDGESADTGLEVRTGSLPIDGNETLDRTAAMLGVPIDPPVVHVDDSSAGGASGVRDPSSFDALVGMPFPDGNDVGGELTVGGAASPFAAVYVTPTDESSAAEIEQVLVHELVHVAQFQHRAPQQVRAAIPEAHRTTRDAELVVTSLTEGGAVYGSSVYTERHDLAIDPETEILERLYPNASVGTKLVWGPYHYGAQYIDSVAADPDSHWEVYEAPPVTMRQVLHGETDETGETALEPFEATLADDDGDWDRTRSETMGEFVVRLVLETELPAETSADAASGWVYDRQLRVANADESLDGHAWSVRFEDSSNASTYATALTSYLDARADSTEGTVSAVDPSNASAANSSEAVESNATWYTDDYAFAVSAPDERTVTLLGGPEAFVEAASVAATADADVRLSTTGPRDENATTRSIAAPDPAVGAVDGPTSTNGIVAP